MVKNPPTSAGDLGDKGSTLGSGRPPEVKNGNLPVFLPGKFHGKRGWQAIVHEATKSQTRLSTA